MNLYFALRHNKLNEEKPPVLTIRDQPPAHNRKISVAFNQPRANWKDIAQTAHRADLKDGISFN